MSGPQSCATVNLRAETLPVRRSKGIDIDDLKSRVVAPTASLAAIGTDVEIGRAP